MIDISYLDPWAQQLINECGYEEWTEIQNIVLPNFKQYAETHDHLIVAPTGSGKTLAYGLSILVNLNEEKYGIHSLIILPTKELVIQVSEQINLFGKHLDLKLTSIIGGAARHKQIKAIEENPHVVVATLGRILDIFKFNKQEVKRVARKIKFVVLDEIDYLINENNIDALTEFMEFLPKKRSLVMCSATIDSKLNSFYSQFGKIAALNQEDKNFKFERCETLKLYITESASKQYIKNDNMDENIEDVTSTQLNACVSSYLKHYFIMIKPNLRLAYIINLLKQHELFAGSFISDKQQLEADRGIKYDNERRYHDINAVVKRVTTQGIIFVNKIKDSIYVAAALRQLDFSVVELHSEVSTEDRQRNMKKFKNRECLILVATDIASRGLDVPSVKWVINYNLQPEVNNYVHRSGRAGRAQKSGVVLSFLTHIEDGEIVENIENTINSCNTDSKFEIEELDLSKDFDEIKELNKIKNAEVSAVKLLRERSKNINDNKYGRRSMKLNKKNR